MGRVGVGDCYSITTKISALNLTVNITSICADNNNAYWCCFLPCVALSYCAMDEARCAFLFMGVISMFEKKRKAKGSYLVGSLAVFLTVALVVPMMTVPVLAGGVKDEVKKLGLIAAAIDRIDQADAKYEVEEGLKDLTATPPDSAGAAGHNKQAVWLLTVAISSGADTMGIVNNLLKCIIEEEGLTKEEAHNVKCLAASLVQLRAAGVDTKAYKDTEAAVKDLLFGPIVFVNNPPVAVTGGPYVADLGTSLTLDATGSYDPDTASGDTIVAYTWTITGKQQTASGSQPVLPAEFIDGIGIGTWELVLTVKDANGTSTAAATTLTVYENRPYAKATVNPLYACLGQPVVFDASTSTHSRPDRGIVSYAWLLPDGTIATGAVVVRSFFAQGLYRATVTVTDNNVPAKTDAVTVAFEVLPI